MLFSTCSVLAEGTSATISFVSDYDYRGLTQTSNGPAFQPTLEYKAGAVHLQVFASNVTFAKPRRLFGAGHTEFAWIADFTGAASPNLQYDVGVSYFQYPGFKPNDDFGEIFGTLAWNWLSTSLHYSPNYDNLRPWLSAAYFEANVRWPIGQCNINVLAHAGESWGPYWNAANQGRYLDYFLGAEKEFKSATLSLRLVGTRRYVDIPNGDPLSGRARVVLGISIPLQ